MRKVTLGEVCSRGSSNIAQKDLNGNNGKYPIYGASGLIKCVDFYHQGKEYVAVVKDGAGIGRTMLLPANSSVIGTMQYLIPNEDVDVRYLYYAVLNMNLSKYFSGATIPHIYFRDYQDEEFMLPSMSEQGEKADNLQKIERLITVKQTELTKLNDLVKSRFVEMFGDPIRNPRGWEVTTIGDIVTDVRYGTSKPAVKGGKYPYLRMNNLTFDGRLDLTDLKYIDIPDEELEKSVVRKGDVLFNRTNSVELVGKTATFDFNQEMVIAGYIIRVRLNERMLPEVFSQYMNLEALKTLLRDMAKGAVNQANINAQELQSIKVYVPDIDSQKRFVDIKVQTDKSKYCVKNDLLRCLLRQVLNKSYRR